MYKQLVDEKALNDCLAKENYLEAIQMLRKEMMDNFDTSPELMKKHGEIYATICGVTNNSGMPAKAIYEFISTMRTLLLK